MRGMNTRRDSNLLPRRLVQFLCALAAVAGAKLGYDFGIQIGGPPVGFLTAANTALFGWLMVSAMAGLVQRFSQRRQPPQG
jgi:hypothetical protein